MLVGGCAGQMGHRKSRVNGHGSTSIRTSYEMKPFYEKHGYTLFATLATIQKGTASIFSRKNCYESAFVQFRILAR
jgi:hypothetical protein